MSDEVIIWYVWWERYCEDYAHDLIAGRQGYDDYLAAKARMREIFGD